MARFQLLLVVLALLVPAPAALAQSGGGAFGPLPPAQPAETPPPDPGDAGAVGDVSRQTMILIGVAVIGAFFLLGWAITRDARRNLTEADRAAVEGEGVPGAAPRKQDRAKMKERQRAKTRAQRQARKKARRAGR